MGADGDGIRRTDSQAENERAEEKKSTERILIFHLIHVLSHLVWASAEESQKSFAITQQSWATPTKNTVIVFCVLSKFG